MQKLFTFLSILLTIYSTSSAQNGIVKNYYPDGSTQSEISYVNDILDGSAIWYYPNGQLKSEKNFSKGILEGWVKEYYESGILKEEYFVQNGIKDGAHKIYNNDSTLKKISNYANGIQTQSQTFGDETESKVQRSSIKIDDTVIKFAATDSVKVKPQPRKIERSGIKYQCNVEVCPEPVGGMKSIQDNLVYPEHALRYGLEGIVTLIVKISSVGEVVNTEIVRGMGFGCSEAAQEAVKKTKFLPGENFGVPVESEITLSIEFKIFETKSFPESKEK
ncbi:MAG: TonB family protein [Ignavibacteriales bacterium]|nr:TonB family protein [Ignavibacteriales bacterium]